MNRHEEHRAELEAELRSYGLRPQFVKDSKAWEVTWLTPQGAKRRFVASSTPSGYRTTLNERARLRRICKSDGLKRQQSDDSAKPASFAKYFELPKAAEVKRDTQRIEELEARVAELSDLLVDLLARGLPAQQPAAQLVAPPAAPITQRNENGLTPLLQQTLELLSDKQQKLEKLVEKCEGVSPAALSQRLRILRSMELAESFKRSGWTKAGEGY